MCAHSFIHSFILIHRYIYPCIHSFICPSIHPSVHPSIQSFTVVFVVIENFSLLFTFSFSLTLDLPPHPTTHPLSSLPLTQHIHSLCAHSSPLPFLPCSYPLSSFSPRRALFRSPPPPLLFGNESVVTKADIFVTDTDEVIRPFHNVALRGAMAGEAGGTARWRHGFCWD